MARQKINLYYELIRRYREDEDGPILEETLGLYCSKGRALNEKEIYLETELHEVQDEITIDLKVRKYKETIEEVELISIDELNALAESLDNEYYIYP